MNKNKQIMKRGFAFFVALMMCLSVIQTTALAAGEDIAQGSNTSADTEVSEETIPNETITSGNGSASDDNLMPDDGASPDEGTVPATEDTGIMSADESGDISAEPADAAESDIFFVQDTGKEDAAGSEQDPLPSLAKAVEKANRSTKQHITINLLSDVTAVECARINGKFVTLNGNGHTVTRGSGFEMISDNARSWYHPAMIEVCDSTGSKTASLRLENITLDDACLTEGTKYSQASTNGAGGNGDMVQDAVIATYDGVGTITLGSGVTLKGYGGMSAVRLSGGTLIMEAGSVITGGKSFATKGGGSGAAGAVWIQGGSFTMNVGASIHGVTGRGVYLDGGGSKALINGTISDIIPNSNMWQGSDGVAMHIRNESSAVLGSTGKVMNIEGGSCAFSIISSSFTAQNGSEISGLKNTRVANANGAKAEDQNPHIVLFDGSVRDCTYGDVQFGAWYARYIIGPDAAIENTTASSRSIGMFYLQNGGEMEIGGKIQNNNNTVVYMGNQGGGGTIVKVKDGAYIHNNNGYGIYANNSGYVIMEGGEISANKSYGLYIRAKSNWPDSRLDMTGGRIVDNKSYGIYYSADKGKSCYMNITGGEISGNGNNGAQISVSGAYAQDKIGRAQIHSGVVRANNGQDAVIGTSFGRLTFDEDYADIYLGNAMSQASGKLKELVPKYKVNAEDANDYVTKGSALWVKPTSGRLHFTTPQPSKYTVNYVLPLYVAYIPLQADGTAPDDAKLTVVPVENVSTVDITLSDLEPGQPYALMWMQPKEKFGTLTVAADQSNIPEVLGQSDYTLGFTAEYTLSKDIASAAKEFTVKIQLDSRLSYQEDSLKFADDSNEIYELIGEPEMDRDHNLIIRFKVKDDASAKGTEKARLTFRTTASFTDFPEDTLKTDGTVTGSVRLEGKDTSFEVKTPAPCRTTLTPLPAYVITYTGGSVRVKEGTELRLNLAEGSIGGKVLPGVIEADLTLPDPFRIGYNFNGWNYVLRKDVSGKVYILFGAGWMAIGQPTVPATPATPTPATPTAPAAAALAPAAVTLAPPAAAALQPVADPETPLARVTVADDGDEPTVKVEDPEVPLASGASWAVLNLLLMILTVGAGLLFTMSAMVQKKQEDEAEDEETEGTPRKAIRMISIIPAALSAVIFFLTEDITARMTFVDHMTITMVLVTVAQVILIAFLAQKNDDKEKECV